MRQLAFGVLVVGIVVVGKEAIADDTRSASTPTPMYVIHMKLLEDDEPAPGEKVATKVLGAPAVAVAENVEAHFHVGGIFKIGSDEVKYGTMANVRVKPAQDGKVIVAGAVDVSTAGLREEGLVARQGISMHFSRTMKLGETLRLPNQKPAGNKHRLELRVDRVDEMKPVASRAAVAK